jgi:hypothetical protein
MTDPTATAAAWPRLAAPVATRPKGPCLSALSPSRARRLACTNHDHAATPAAESII